MEVLNLWEAGEMGWASTMLSILWLKEGLREESWEGAGSRNTRYVRKEGGLDLPDPLPLQRVFFIFQGF